jgi:hypothetical protein
MLTPEFGGPQNVVDFPFFGIGKCGLPSRDTRAEKG